MIWKFYAVSAALSWSKRASVAEDLALVLPILTLGLLFFRMPFDEVAGIFADACGNPAILAYSNKLTPTDRADCAMIFPDMTVVKILFVDIVQAFF